MITTDMPGLNLNAYLCIGQALNNRGKEGLTYFKMKGYLHDTDGIFNDSAG